MLGKHCPLTGGFCRSSNEEAMKAREIYPIPHGIKLEEVFHHGIGHKTYSS
jgi:hypothetical protein